MSVFLEIAAFLLVVNNDYLGRAANLLDLAFDDGLGNERGANRSVFAVINQKDLVKYDRIAFGVFARQFLNGDQIAL